LLLDDAPFLFGLSMRGLTPRAPAFGVMQPQDLRLMLARGHRHTLLSASADLSAPGWWRSLVHVGSCAPQNAQSPYGSSRGWLAVTGSSRLADVISQTAREFLGCILILAARSPIVGLTLARSVGHSMMTCGLMGLSRIPSKKKRTGKQRAQSMPRSQVTGNQFVNLVAAMLTAHAPFAEVLAIVRQQVVAIFA
jgi:hypothetical protein